MIRRLLLTGFVSGLFVVSTFAGAQTTPLLAGVASPPTWKIDATHSELSFSIRHLVSRVRGQFDVWGGTIVADPTNWNTASVDVTAQASSINTNNERRDADLRGPGHFDADENPTVKFRSTRVRRLAGDSVEVSGNLTMHGVTRPITLRGHFNGMTGAPGRRRAGFEASAVINRQDFNMTWNRMVEGTALLGDEVRIDINIAAVEQGTQATNETQQ